MVTGDGLEKEERVKRTDNNTMQGLTEGLSVTIKQHGAFDHKTVKTIHWIISILTCYRPWYANLDIIFHGVLSPFLHSTSYHFIYSLCDAVYCFVKSY